MKLPGSEWTAQQDAKLARLWLDDRLTSSMLAEIFGRTRNAIMGRVGRLGLVRTPLEQSAPALKPRAERKSPLSKRKLMRFNHDAIPKSEVPMPVLPPEQLTGQPVTLADRRSDQCGWPVNDGEPFLFCAAPVAPWHKRYCIKHAFAGARRRAA